MNPWQRQYEATGRRRERSPAAPTPRYGSRRRPEWNGYLTDSDRYKLSQQEQVRRAVCPCQLSRLPVLMASLAAPEAAAAALDGAFRVSQSVEPVVCGAAAGVRCGAVGWRE